MLERGHLKEQWVIECPIISNYSATGFRTVPVYIRHSTFQQFESVNHMIVNIISRTRARAALLHVQTFRIYEGVSGKRG